MRLKTRCTEIAPALRWYFLLFLPLLFCGGCGLYSFKGTSIPPEMKTVTVQFFENNALLVVPNLSSKFTTALISRIRTQSRLDVRTANTNADGNFEGTITDYSYAPVAIQGNDRAGLLRLTITVSVKYTNSKKPKDDFEQSFSRYADFPPPLSSVEQAKIDEINKMLTEDIFNRAFANW